MFSASDRLDVSIHMKNYVFTVIALSIFVGATPAQSTNGVTPTSSSKSVAIPAPVELAKLAVEAHGGEKLRKMKTLSVIGAVDVTASAMPQPIASTFVTIFAGDKYRVEINNPFQPLKQ